MTQTAISVEAVGLTKTYRTGPSEVRAVDDATFSFAAGEFVVLVGPSGSGKTTCLNLIGAIEPPSGGRLTVDGVDVGALDLNGQTDYRRNRVGFIFQFFNLVPTLTALENVQLVAELGEGDAEERSRKALGAVGLEDRIEHYPGQLSGGEQQRVAIARALVKEPRILLCDEPTGALDLNTGRQILELLQESARGGATVLLVTHNSFISEIADRVVRLRDGHIVEDERREHPMAAEDLSW